MKSEKFLQTITAVIWVILLAVMGLMLLCICKLNMLPWAYLAVLGGVLLGLWGLLGVLVWFRTKRSGHRAIHVRQILSQILALVLILACGIVTAAVSKAYQTLDSISNTSVKTTSVNIFVRMDDPAQTLEHAGDYTFAVMQDKDSQVSRKAVEAVEKELGHPIAQELCAGPAEMVEALLDRRVDAIIISASYIHILEENNLFENLLQQIRELYTLSLTEQIKVPEGTRPQQQEDDPAGETKPAYVRPTTGITTHPFVVYISGSDTRTEFLVARNSDVNILAVVNPVTKQVLLVNTPRDYYIPNPAGGGALDKLTHLGGFGVDVSMRGLSELYGMDIDYYAQICFSGFETLIDAVGGVEVYSDHSFQAADIFVQEGCNYFDGADALKFCRERKRLPMGDIDRGKNQMKVIQAVVDKLTSSKLITNYSEILDSLEGMFATNISTKDISAMVKMQLNENVKWDVFSYSSEGYGSWEETYSMPGSELSVMIPYQSQVDHAAELIDRVLAGEKLTQDDLKLPE